MEGEVMQEGILSGTYWKGVNTVDADNGIEVLVTFIKPLIRVLTTQWR